jgi:hypothetical protein
MGNTSKRITRIEGDNTMATDYAGTIKTVNETYKLIAKIKGEVPMYDVVYGEDMAPHLAIQLNMIAELVLELKQKSTDASKG